MSHFADDETLALIEQLQAKVAEQQAEIDHLRMALADTKALEIGTAERCDRWRGSYKMQEKHLAASQLSEKRLREAVEVAAAHVKPTCFDLYEQLQEALATPSLTESLDAYVA